MAISKADYLVTGDKDLLILNPFGTTTVLTPGDFEKMLS
jgi:predicted nucleic acid-binding protein